MKRSVVVIAAVAILGIMAFYKDHGISAATLAPPSSTKAGSISASSSGGAQTAAGYKDGTFTGDPAYIPYGTVQIAVVIKSGKITGVQYLQMPNAQGYSRQVAAAAEPLLTQTTLQKQSANIDFVSGATATSMGYQQSLQSALDKSASGTGSTGQSGTSGSGSSTAPPNYIQSNNIPQNYDN